MATSLSAEQIKAITVTERVCSCISILSIGFIVVTYLAAPHFDKLINRMIFFACLGNLGSNVAALIGDTGLQAGRSSALCQGQAFLVQMFLGIDALWAFCMAINVYLAFFYNVPVQQFRKLDRYYLTVCYGLAFIPAFAFCFIKTKSRGSVYGPATIWCWISSDWEFLRIGILYACVWLAILFALAIYIRAGLVIYKRRQFLSGFLDPFNENPFKATVTQEVHVTSEPRRGAENYVDGDPVAAFDETELRQFRTHTNIDIKTASSHGGDEDRSEHGGQHKPGVLRMRSLTRKVAEDSVNPEAWLYARVAFLFYVALMITWIPSSINRIYPLVNPGKVSFGLSLTASLVLPLQGFWNLFVYIITSQTATRNLFRRIFGGGRGIRPTNHQLRETFADRLKRHERLDSEEDTLYLN